MAPVRDIAVFRLVAPALLLAVACSAVLWAGGGGAGATSFAPSFGISIEDAAPGAASDITFGFDIGAPDANFLQLVTFAPGPFEFSRDDEVTTGALAGTVSAQATLGLVNGACNSDIDVVFQMYEASTDTTQTIPLYAGLEDFNGNGLVDNIDRYPSFLAQLAPNLQPVQRLYGQLLISGLWTPLNFVMFEPGAPIPLHPPFDESLGYPIVVVLLDPLAAIEQSNISDFCSPLATTTELFGVSRDNPGTAANESGQVLHRNPAADGEYTWTMFARSRWDADGDGHENDMDPCPFTPDPDWDPRANSSPGDKDQDGLPASCDFDDNSYNSDQDGDTWLNRLDLCPTLVNQSSYFQYDEDDDGIGDECDPAPGDASDGGTSHRHDLCLTGVTPIGAGGASGSGDPPCPTGPDLQVPPTMSVYGSGAYPVGEVASIEVSLYDAKTFDGFSGVTVDFEITGANPTVGSCLTAAGHCEFNYIGANTGTDTVTISASPGGTAVERTVEVEWVLPPPNDAAGGALPIDAIPFSHQQTLVGAGRDGEPEGCGFGEQTVWFTYTPVQDEFISVSATNADGPALVAIFEGTPANLTFVGCSAYGSYRQGRPAPAGFGLGPSAYYLWLDEAEQYLFQLSGYAFDGDQGATFALDHALVGEANCDGQISTTDALAVLQRLAYGLSSPCLAGGDVDCDGVIETVDALEILRRIAGLSNKVGCL